MATESRNPEKFLKQITEEERREKSGKLKIYFGAAPGVGKTHTMLQDAIIKRQQGVDVVVGIVESHGRAEIEALLKNLDIIPRQTVLYRDKSLLEFDLNAAIARKPALILIDEMAHTNVPGLRHNKRWQDIKEILDCGIDVYTTLNVQHIESINDDVAQIIGTKVRETVSDSIIELADTIELVDLTAEDLLKRLNEGKVYFPDQAELAVENFFRKDKLTALRELALRITAERVGAQVMRYRETENTKGVWPSQEKILVCIGPTEESLKLIRTAKRIATLLRTDWIALYVDAPKLKLTTQERKQSIQHLHIAEQLGAQTRVLTGIDVVKEIIHFAREQNVTQIVIGKRIRPRWKNFFIKSLADELVRQSGEIDIYVVTSAFSPSPVTATPTTDPIPWKIYGVAFGVVLMATLIDLLLFPFFASSNLIMMYLLGITCVALFGRIGPSIFASVLSVLTYDLVFIVPYRFRPNDFQYIFTLIVMLIVGQIISSLTILTRRQATSSYLTEHQTHMLHNLSRQLASTRGVDKILEISVKYISEMFHCEVLTLRRNKMHLMVSAYYPAEKNLSAKELSVAQWVYEMGQNAGLGTDTLSFSEALYLPLLASKGSIGVLRIKPTLTELFSPEQIRLLESCAHQIAMALEADRIEERDRKSELQEAIDHVRNQLLQDISHDLRAPLIAAMGFLSSIVEGAKKMTVNDIQHDCQKSYFELETLNRLISNLLQITYLEKSVVLEKEYTSLRKLINLAVDAMSRQLEEYNLNIVIPVEIPPVPVDAIMLTDVFKNLLENAIKFSAKKTTITISAFQKGHAVVVSVKDEGPGIVADEKDKLFEKFYRGREIATERGLGLGLAICQKIIEAHGGEIWAENHPDGGATFSFSLVM